jgi:hypothetical protein
LHKLKVCIFCGGTVPLDAMKRQRGDTCKAPDCKRRQEAHRKRVYRARQRMREIQTPGPALEAPSGWLSPWGQVYESEEHSWADCLLDGGGTGDLARDEQRRRYDLMDALRQPS